MRSRIRPSACSREQCVQLGAVERRGVVLRDRVAVALLPVAEDVAEQIARPRGTTLEEREPQFGNRIGTPPKNSDLAVSSPAAAKFPMWLNT